MARHVNIHYLIFLKIFYSRRMHLNGSLKSSQANHEQGAVDITIRDQAAQQKLKHGSKNILRPYASRKRFQVMQQ